ncbi:hypothetical protein [Mangrovihabitans endophyticus]|uniref:Uncharacterized protein n=1 Tax=Mangrovihabitans endophyticus TaxID=1751298 RepID=A0A8J3FTT9_9ACTN|nr:hypothetical protein [Mangrovihabitans endophyticus]GGL21584.1 hypothetical protein GCM10012284_65200 [Mangrovihabitans endophyticus]
MSGPLPAPGPELGRRNRRLIAERLHWPDGALEACERIDRCHPGWMSTWAPGGGVEWVERGFYAQPRLARRSDPRWLFGATPLELLAALDDHITAERAERARVSRWRLT